jgi:hypothetical protein
MDGECCFVMHPDDEASFIDAVLDEPAVQIVDGHYWKSATPPCTRLCSELNDTECLIWSPDDLPELKACQVLERWSCDSLHAAIHFSRSEMHDSVITAGRIAFRTDVHPDFPASSVTQLKKRFNRLRRVIKKTYINSAIQWCNPKLPRRPPSERRSGNPGKPDSRHWIGPNALEWLRDDRTRRVKQFMQLATEAFLCDNDNAG